MWHLILLYLQDHVIISLVWYEELKSIIWSKKRILIITRKMLF